MESQNLRPHATLARGRELLAPPLALAVTPCLLHLPQTLQSSALQFQTVDEGRQGHGAAQAPLHGG